MKFIKVNPYKLYSFLAGIILLSATCKKTIQEEIVIYKNDMEKADLTAISGGKTTTFQNTKVLGRYNKSGFRLNLNDLPSHNMVQVSFDLYIHDSWDGNKGNDDGPDLWQMTIDGQGVINTTFSNRPCAAYWDCDLQSYPGEYPQSSLPRASETRVNLPGACVLASEKGSSLYRIVKLIRHSGTSLTLEYMDQLKQTNAQASAQECDESWSMDNIEIKAIKY
ncbi:MAG TPA: hypothetical protein VNI52_05970 [Sphingobacteriaceae bacterium]|nr:hypothetical protein [Sphingobacteriaceae bacterium]